MGEFVEFEVVDLGYYNPETGKDVLDITGRHNKPGVDPFTHRGRLYPEISKQKEKILMRRRKREKLLLELNITPEEADKIKEFKAKWKKKDQVEADWGIKQNMDSGVTN